VPAPARAPRPVPSARSSRPGGRLTRTVRALGLPVLLGAAVTAAAPELITVQSGDTLSHIAARHGISVAELQRINELGSSTMIYAGQQLEVGAASGSTSAGSSSGDHTIASGETLSGIASRYGVSQDDLAAANGLTVDSIIYAGQSLDVPGSGGAAPTPSRSASSISSVDRQQVREIIADTAAEYGVDPSLALAIAHQESGFQQDVVSSADAIGVMQVLPTTVDWMEAVVGHDLDPYDVHDNVETGVALLSVLRDQVGLEDTIAAYYQGLGAVQRVGWYQETYPYVANVRALQEQYS